MTRRLVLLLALALGVAGCHPAPPIVIPPPVCQPPDPACTPPPHPHTGETGTITAHDKQFWSEDGQAWTWAGTTDFSLFGRFLDGEDINPQLTQRVAAGVRVVRVLGMVDSFRHLYPQEHPDYYDQLHAFLDLCYAYGLRVEFVTFADAAVVMPDPGQQDAHAEAVFQALAGWADAHGFTVFNEIGNEVMKESNLPGGETRAYEIGRKLQGHSANVLIATGGYVINQCQQSYHLALDYMTDHTERGEEWTRKIYDAGQHRDGFQWGDDCSGVSWEGFGVPTVADEPMGISETLNSGSRTTSVAEATGAGGVAGLETNGITCHSDGGIQSEMWGEVTNAACTAMMTAVRFYPPRLQLGGHMRGGSESICRWAYGPTDIGPVEHRDPVPGDLRDLRSFAKWEGNTFWGVQAMGAHLVVMCPGYILDAEPLPGIFRAHLQ